MVQHYHLNIYIVIFSNILITASNGLMISMSMAAAIAQFKHQSGLAAGLLGTVQLLSGAIASFIVGLVGDNFNLFYFAWFTFVGVVFFYCVYSILCSAQKKSLAL